jgi:hypothetical protein
MLTILIAIFLIQILRWKAYNLVMRWANIKEILENFNVPVVLVNYSLTVKEELASLASNRTIIRTGKCPNLQKILVQRKKFHNLNPFLTLKKQKILKDKIHCLKD